MFLLRLKVVDKPCQSVVAKSAIRNCSTNPCAGRKKLANNQAVNSVVAQIVNGDLHCDFASRGTLRGCLLNPKILPRNHHSRSHANSRFQIADFCKRRLRHKVVPIIKSTEVIAKADAGVPVVAQKISNCTIYKQGIWQIADASSVDTNGLHTVGKQRFRIQSLELHIQFRTI